MTERCFDPTHRSWSGDRGFDECQWRDSRYRERSLRAIASPRMAVGSVVDDAICEIVVGRTPDIEALVNRTATEAGIWSERWDEMTGTAIELVTLWTNEVWLEMPALYGVQHELHWRWHGATYHAHLDLVLADGSIIDTKTSGKRLADRRADTDDQLTYYAWALRSVYGALPPMVGLDGLIAANPPADVLLWHPEARKPWYDRQRSTRTNEQVDAIAQRAWRRERVRRYADRTRNHLANGRSVAFACDDCRVKAECPAWTGFQVEEVRYVAVA